MDELPSDSWMFCRNWEVDVDGREEGEWYLERSRKIEFEVFLILIFEEFWAEFEGVSLWSLDVLSLILFLRKIGFTNLRNNNTLYINLIAKYSNYDKDKFYRKNAYKIMNIKDIS